MASMPPTELPPPSSDPVSPGGPGPEISPPGPDTDVPDPGMPAGDPGTAQPAEI